jgi:hypothetical protein
MSKDAGFSVLRRKTDNGESQFECKRCGVEFTHKKAAKQCCKPDDGRWFLPAELKQIEYPMWVLWNGEIKRPLAPWVDAHLFPIEWAADNFDSTDERPELMYSKVARIATDRSLLQYYGQTPATEDRDDQETLPPDEVSIRPTVILPHRPMEIPSSPVTFVDFDDVRNPDTGDITDEAWRLLDWLDCFAEISTSGTGVHALVRGKLPDTYEQLQAPLQERGHIEIYDHSRMVGLTGNHLEGTPLHAVPERSDVLTMITGYCEEVRQQQGPNRTPEKQPAEDDTSRDNTTPSPQSEQNYTTPSTENPYYNIDIRDVADVGRFQQYRCEAPGDDWKGPHPTHGAASGSDWDDASDNFDVEPRENVWYCFLHDVGGGPLSLIAVLEDIISCRNAGEVYGNNRLLAKACVAAREKYVPELSQAPPPHDACVGILRLRGREVLNWDDLTPIDKELAENLIQSEMSMDGIS